MVRWMTVFSRDGWVRKGAGMLLAAGLLVGVAAISVHAQPRDGKSGKGKHAGHGQMSAMQGSMEMGHGRLKFYMDDGRRKLGGQQAQRAAYTIPADITLIDQDGRPVRLAALLAESLDRDPDLRARLLTDRNRRWVARLNDLLARPGTHFVAVGAAHLAGPANVVELLAKDGVAVERLR